jgi:hypothetical protein
VAAGTKLVGEATQPGREALGVVEQHDFGQALLLSIGPGQPLLTRLRRRIPVVEPPNGIGAN